MSGSGQSAGTMTEAQRQWMRSFLKLDAAPAAAGEDDGQLSGGPGSPAQVVPDTLPQAEPAGGMKDEEIAAAIMDKQAAILIGWQTALTVFDNTMKSSADAEASPDYQKVVLGYFADKLMGAMLKKAPGAEELASFAGAIAGEAQRAATAGASAKLRDFVNEHVKAVGRLHKAVVSQRQGFISAVRARREAVEAPRAAPPAKKGAKPVKKGQGVVLENTKADDDYGMMRMELMDVLADLDAREKAASPEALFRVLTEEWVRHAQVVGGMGVKFAAVVVIRIDAGYRIMDAHIQGAGGQKLAEQLLKDSPDGVDVLGLKTRRVIKLMAANGWPSAMLTLDMNNRDVSTGSIAEGNTDALYKVLMSKGLPKTKVLTGD